MRRQGFAIALVATAALAGGGSIAASRFLANSDVPRSAAVIVGLAPVALCAAFIALAIRVTRELDEFERRVQFDALLLAFLGAVLVAIAGKYLHLAHLTPGLQWDDVFPVLVGCYVVGFAVAHIRFRRRSGGAE